MTSAAKRHRLTFPLSALAPVRTGAKCATVRLSKRAAAIRSGDRLTLAFGRYDAPVLVAATAARVEHVDLSAELRRYLELPADVDSLIAERRFYQQAKTPDDATPTALIDALADAGGEFGDVLAEAAARNETVVTCVWWSFLAAAV